MDKVKDERWFNIIYFIEFWKRLCQLYILLKYINLITIRGEAKIALKTFSIKKPEIYLIRTYIHAQLSTR